MGGRGRRGCKGESITGLSVPEGELLFIASPCCVLVMSYPPSPYKTELVFYLTPIERGKKEEERGGVT